nr:lITAF domain-containing protein isoform X1 [Pan paniscus]
MESSPGEGSPHSGARAGRDREEVYSGDRRKQRGDEGSCAELGAALSPHHPSPKSYCPHQSGGHGTQETIGQWGFQRAVLSLKVLQGSRQMRLMTPPHQILILLVPLLPMVLLTGCTLKAPKLFT